MKKLKGDLDWNEYNASLSYGIFSTSLNYSSDVYGSGETEIYSTFGLEYKLPEGFAIAVDLNFYDYDDVIFSDTVQDCHLGVSKSL